jgi:hypothetical protein
MRLIARWKNRPKPVRNVIERTKRKVIFGAIGLGVVVGVVAVLVFKGCGG